MKIKDLILIGLVCVNAMLAVLAVSFYLSNAEPAAYANGAESRAGDYIILTGQVTNNRDALLVIDVIAQRANLYMAKAAVGPAAGGRWDLADTRNLVLDFATGR